MSNFVIFCDQENLQEKAPTTFADAKRDRQKLAPLTNKAIYDENALENQVRKKACSFVPFCLSFTYPLVSLQITKPQKSTGITSTVVSAAFKQKNVFTEKEIQQKPKVQEVFEEEEESIINVTTEEACLEQSSSFT
jgi:hypothetical protein